MRCACRRRGAGPPPPPASGGGPSSCWCRRQERDQKGAGPNAVVARRPYPHHRRRTIIVDARWKLPQKPRPRCAARRHLVPAPPALLLVDWHRQTTAADGQALPAPPSTACGSSATPEAPGPAAPTPARCSPPPQHCSRPFRRAAPKTRRPPRARHGPSARSPPPEASPPGFSAAPNGRAGELKLSASANLWPGERCFGLAAGLLPAAHLIEELQLRINRGSRLLAPFDLFLPLEESFLGGSERAGRDGGETTSQQAYRARLAELTGAQQTQRGTGARSSRASACFMS